MQTPSPWATKADVEAAREELKADIAALHANLTAMHGDLRAVQALLTEQNKRRPWWRRLFAAGVVLMAVMAAGAEARADRAIDGNRLYDLCRPNSRSSTFCGDYVLSIADALMLGRVGRWTACLPIGVTDDQVIDVAERFLEAHPARRGSAASELVAEALAEAYPCR